MIIPPELVEAAVARTPPPNSFTVSDYMKYPGVPENIGRDKATTILSDFVESGKLCSGKYSTKQGPTWYYWPAPNPKARKG